MLIGCVASAALALVLVGIAAHEHEHVSATSRQEAQQAASNAAGLVQEKLKKLSVAKKIADDLTSGRLDYQKLESRLKADMDRLPEISSLTVAYLPEFNPSHSEPRTKGSFWIYVHREPSGVMIETGFTDYSAIRDSSSRWYHGPKEARKPTWSQQSYYDPRSKEWWSGGYGAPFFRSNIVQDKREAMIGIVSADFTLDKIGEVVAEEVNNRLGKEKVSFDVSHAFIVSSTGHFIEHPELDLVREESKVLKEFYPSLDTSQAIRKLPEVQGTTVRQLEHRDERSGRTYLVFFKHVPDPDWWVAVVLDKEAVERGPKVVSTIKDRKVGIALATLAFFVFIVGIAVRADRGTTWRLWIVSLVFSAGCLAGVVYLWVLAVSTDVASGREDVQILSEAISAKTRLRYQLDHEQSKVVAIPTGVFVQSIEFSSAHNVLITGYVWQKYGPDVPCWARPKPDQAGFILPEAENADILAAYESKEGDKDVRGWYFRALLRQEFDYGRYPFDQEVVWIRLWHNVIGGRAVLAPDLSSYKTLVPTKRPGVESDLVVEGWEPTQSYFSYRWTSYNTDFGLTELETKQNFPELYFNIGLARRFLNPFITNMIPLTVTSFLLFTVLLTIRSSQKASSLFGFNTSTALGFCAALFFVVILAHTSLRDLLSAERIIYIEYFYFVMYVAILAVGVVAVAIASPRKFAWIHYRDNLISRLLFWPLYSLSMLLLTLYAFG